MRPVFSEEIPHCLRCVDALRGVAALAVLGFHAFGELHRGSHFAFEGRWAQLGAGSDLPTASAIGNGLFGFGYLGVSLFFVLSGFCIHLRYAQGRRPLDLRAFLIRRLVRLYPAYLAVVGLVLGLKMAQGLASGQGWGELVAGPLAPGYALGHLLMWFHLAPPSESTYGTVAVLWSIAIEVHFYLAYLMIHPLIARLGRPFFRVGVPLILGVGLMYYAIFEWRGLAETWPTWSHPRVFFAVRLGEWLLGAWIAEWIASGRARLHGPGIVRARVLVPAGLGVVIFGVSAVIVLGAGYQISEPIASIGFALVTLGLVSHEIRHGQRSRPTRPTRLLMWVGERSYSLYLIHFVPLVALPAIAAWLWSTSVDAMGGTLALAAIILGSIPICFASADVLYRTVERPSHRLARSLSLPRSRRAPIDPLEPVESSQRRAA